MAVHHEMGEPPRGGASEALKMYIEPHVVGAVAQQTLHMEAEGRERWCISWLQWFWEQEIERAICDVKQGRL